MFLLLYYRLGGFVAILGLLVHALFLFGCMAMFGLTLTLPGIAGMILTIGMGVDANVLIYERMREELEAGKSLTAAIGAAYGKAFSAIFDSNITSLITAAILFWQGQRHGQGLRGHLDRRLAHLVVLGDPGDPRVVLVGRRHQGAAQDDFPAT